MTRCRSSEVLLKLMILFCCPVTLWAQGADSPDVLPVEPVIRPAPAPSDDRILGVMPNFQTVEDPDAHLPPLTVRQKFRLFIKETVDPYTFVSAAAGAGMSQYGNGTPAYGGGMASYGQRLGAAYADVATQSFFSDAVLASLLHEDPRYYRMGPAHSIPRRILYSMTRMVITRTDAGSQTFNFSGVGGMAMGIALSNAYYPSQSVSGSVTGSRFFTSLTSASLGNLLPEFWPDIKQKLHHRKN
jgi:hypothetical protein